MPNRNVIQAAYRAHNNPNTPDWSIRAWPTPTIISDVMVYCGCTWTWAPDVSGVMGFPFVLKFANRNCPERHQREYAR